MSTEDPGERGEAALNLGVLAAGPPPERPGRPGSVGRSRSELVSDRA